MVGGMNYGWVLQMMAVAMEAEGHWPWHNGTNIIRVAKLNLKRTIEFTTGCLKKLSFSKYGYDGYDRCDRYDGYGCLLLKNGSIF